MTDYDEYDGSGTVTAIICAIAFFSLIGVLATMVVAIYIIKQII